MFLPVMILIVSLVCVFRWILRASESRDLKLPWNTRIQTSAQIRNGMISAVEYRDY